MQNEIKCVRVKDLFDVCHVSDHKLFSRRKLFTFIFDVQSGISIFFFFFFFLSIVFEGILFFRCLTKVVKFDWVLL